MSSTHPIPNQESTGASISIKIKLELQHSLRATASSRSFRGCLEMPMLTSGHQCGPGFLAELGTCLQLLISHLLSSRRHLGRAGTITQLEKLKKKLNRLSILLNDKRNLSMSSLVVINNLRLRDYCAIELDRGCPFLIVPCQLGPIS